MSGSRWLPVRVPVEEQTVDDHGRPPLGDSQMLMGKSDDIIGATVFLASRGADFITGATLPVDGGYSVY